MTSPLQEARWSKAYALEYFAAEMERCQLWTSFLYPNEHERRSDVVRIAARRFLGQLEMMALAKRVPDGARQACAR